MIDKRVEVVARALWRSERHCPWHEASSNLKELYRLTAMEFLYVLDRMEGVWVSSRT